MNELIKCANCEFIAEFPNSWEMNGKLINFCDTCFSAFKWGWNAQQDKGKVAN